MQLVVERVVVMPLPTTPAHATDIVSVMKGATRMQSFSECVLPHFTGAYKYLLRGMAREGLKCTLSRMTASDASMWENAMKGGIVVQNVLSRLLSF